MTLAYSADHAVCDGRSAATVLSAIKAAFESCDRSLLDEAQNVGHGMVG